MSMSLPEKPDTDAISDGYHTFGELYAHRSALFVALSRLLPTFSWRSRTHPDGTMFDGMFIAGIWLPNGDISYHLPLSAWSHTHHMYTLEVSHPWDGHTSEDVVNRLLAFDPVGAQLMGWEDR